MAYAAVQDMIRLYGEPELITLAPLQPKVAPFYDAERVEEVLIGVSAEMDSYLAVRFDVPLDEAPPLIGKVACDLARADLDRTGRSNVLETAKRHRLWLKDIAQGKATLGSGPVEDPDAVPAANAGGAQVIAEDRVFTDATLQGFLR